MGSERVGIVVGLAAEAKLARSLGWPIAIGGGTAEGAAEATARLIGQGVTALVSFGLAGGLDPALRPGALLIPETIISAEGETPTDPALCARLGGATPHRLLAGTHVLATAADKRDARTRLQADAVDLETGAIVAVAAKSGVPFAALRAVCDPAERDLPPAALVALDQAGGIGLLRVIAAVLRKPAQIGALLTLAKDAQAARTALRRRVALIR